MEEEIDAIKRMLETMQGIYAGTTNPNVHRALIVGAHKGLGQLASAIHECLPIVTADSKGRFSGAQEHGDVHVGRVSDWFAKTIELKSKTDVSSTNVDKELRLRSRRVSVIFGCSICLSRTRGTRGRSLAKISFECGAGRLQWLNGRNGRSTRL
jgi:hypothetical protein